MHRSINVPASLVIRKCGQMSTFRKQFALILSLSSNHFCLLPEIEGYCYSHAINTLFLLNFQSVHSLRSSFGQISAIGDVIRESVMYSK